MFSTELMTCTHVQRTVLFPEVIVPFTFGRRHLSPVLAIGTGRSLLA